MINKYNQIIHSPNYVKEHVYLLEKTTDKNGFFVYDERIVFAQISNSEGETSLTTTSLEYTPFVKIKSVENDSSFKEGCYDFLALKSDEENLVNNFIHLCRAYSKDNSIEFYDFIKNMIDLFQLSRTESKLNTIGFLGELLVIRNSYRKYGKDLSKYWHRSGSYSKCDFALDNSNLEIKTSTTESTTFLLKHNQLFNNQTNYIAIVKIRKVDNNGESLEDIINQMTTQKPFADNVRFQILIKKELNKTFEQDHMKEQYVLENIYYFKNKELETIKNIPACITEISYKYDFDITDSLEEKEIIESL